MLEPARHAFLRAVILFVCGFGLASLALGGGAYLYARHELARRLDDSMAARMVALERTFAQGGRPALLTAIDSFTGHGPRTFGYMLSDRSGHRLRQVDDVPILAPGWGLLGFDDRDDGRIDPARTLTRRLADGSTLTIVADKDFIAQFDAVITGFLFAALALLFMVAAAGALTLERKVRRRIEGLNQTARAIFEGDLEQRVPISPARDEFDAIAGTVNAMLDRLNWTLNEVRRVSAYIAHDLRAPIMRLRDHLQHGSLAAGGMVDMEAVERCEDIIRLFGAILRIGEIDGAMIASTAIELDLSELVAELADAHVAVAEDMGRTLRHDVAPGIRMTGDRDLLAQLLVNLIDNALRHTPAGASVAVALTRDDRHACLVVADDGPSLEEEERRRLTDPRARRVSATTDREGVGLKLAQVIATGHQGSLSLHDNQPGLRVEVVLPLTLARRTDVAEAADA
jgi:signal transduction histidine kinase